MSKDHLFEKIRNNPKLQIVNVGWATFNIKIVKGLKSAKSNCWGTCDFDTYEIHNNIPSVNAIRSSQPRIN